MGLAVDFTTIPEMFDRVTERFRAEARPMLRQKMDGVYRDFTFAEVRALVRDAAAGFAAIGVRRGEMVSIISENRHEWVVADMALNHLGAVSVPLYPTMTPKQIDYVFNDAGVSTAVVSNQLQLAKILKIAGDVKTLRSVVVLNDRAGEEDGKVITFRRLLACGSGTHPPEDFLETLAAQVKPEDLLTVIYTSGTTGNPKGVMLTHRNLVSNVQASISCFPLSYEDVILSFLPLCHSYERMAGYYLAMGCGATIGYAESVETVRENLLEVRPTMMTSVPRLFERLHTRILRLVDAGTPWSRAIFAWAIETGKRHARARKRGRPGLALAAAHAAADRLVFRKIRARTGGRVRFFVSGGAALSRDLGEFFEAVGLQVIEGYGLSESSPVISVNRLDDYRFGTVGKPIPGVEVTIAPDGEILARGPNIMAGYWNKPEETAEAVDREGWLHTGDIGMFDEDGFLKITDRKKHIFVSSGGKNIAPQPIESLLLENDFIDQIVLIGDARMYLTALVVPEFDLLRSHARHHGWTFASDQALVGLPAVRELYERQIERAQKDLPNYERVRKFTLLPAPLSAENGELTPTMKVKRKFVEAKYRDIIERMYDRTA